MRSRFSCRRTPKYSTCNPLTAPGFARAGEISGCFLSDLFLSAGFVSKLASRKERQLPYRLRRCSITKCHAKEIFSAKATRRSLPASPLSNIQTACASNVRPVIALRSFSRQVFQKTQFYIDPLPVDAADRLSFHLNSSRSTDSA